MYGADIIRPHYQYKSRNLTAVRPWYVQHNVKTVANSIYVSLHTHLISSHETR